MIPEVSPTPAVNQPLPDDEKSKLYDYSQHIIQLRRVVSEWKDEIEETEARRKVRKLELDVESLRKTGDIGEDETFIPMRIIDTNIQREQPPYINYLKNSRRIAIFRCKDKFNLDTQRLEEEFTSGMTYEGWETPHYRCLDGSQTHGWDTVEVVYDESKPLHVGIEHIGHDNLYFAWSTKSFADCPRLIRKYDVTRDRLRMLVKKHGFDSAVVNTILECKKNTSEQDDTLCIYKVLFRVDGVVHVGWFSLEGKATSWLKAPQQLYIGIDTEVEETVEVPTGEFDVFGNLITQQQINKSWKPAPVTKFPIFILPYRESEEAKITEYIGRVELDENKQEASSAITSAFVNSLNRAQRVYGSPKNENGSGGKLREITDVKLVNSAILNQPFDFWNFPYPDPVVLNALKYFDIQNAQETNQVAFAVNNREDSRKTAKEISTAEQQQALLNSVQLTLFSTYIRSVYSFAWLIVQSQALQGNIKLLQIEVPQPRINPVDNSVMMDQTGQPIMDPVLVNDNETLALSYEVRAAGDVDVIARQEKLNQMMQDWPVISQTPLRFIFLADMLKLKYPDSGEKYAKLVEQMPMIEQQTGQIQALSTVLQGVMKQYPEIAQSLPPQQLQQLQQIMGAQQPAQ